MPQPVCPYYNGGIHFRQQPTQRRCLLNNHCSSDYSCCPMSCGSLRVCKRSILTDLPPTTPAPNLTPPPSTHPKFLNSSSSSSNGLKDKPSIVRNPKDEYEDLNLQDSMLDSHKLELKSKFVNIGPATPEASSPQYHPKVNVSVVFTSACSYSKWFINYQVHPTMVILRDYINLELLPYGLVHQCLREQQEAWRRVSECGRSGEGIQLFQEAGRRQHHLVPTLRNVPTVAINQVVVLENKDDLSQFSLLCQHLDDLHHATQAYTFCQQVISL
ncbi:putative Gamma interferon inducible lysosomal thiol reductase (GILT)-containing protein [Homarus americanus]|uniref:Putative Gamma interferon inducible lysosomal thiol reductase (GILT)-containing protein n=1 Tax=Homarus americanus TaxID=6706 RepID=A0A8J5MV58_HOMAM|nr:putative Gamma interferon inducible lysosomal thiol reductase (GILT)-containing protein [Homarus americanus]